MISGEGGILTDNPQHHCFHFKKIPHTRTAKTMKAAGSMIFRRWWAQAASVNCNAHAIAHAPPLPPQDERDRQKRQNNVHQNQQHDQAFAVFRLEGTEPIANKKKAAMAREEKVKGCDGALWRFIHPRRANLPNRFLGPEDFILGVL
jgi:hypothetical protein